MGYTLYYWPVPFRGDFIRLLLVEVGAAYTEATPEETLDLCSRDPAAQPFPAMAPPILHDPEGDIFIAQMPAIVMYLAKKFSLWPQAPLESALCLKLLLDSNDVLADITNLNGTVMWEYSTWQAFRQNRLKRWLQLFEQTRQQFGPNSTHASLGGGEQLSLGDLVIYALWGTMIRCLPDLRFDCQQHAPGIVHRCQQLEGRRKIQKFVQGQVERYGDLYCGGHIEASIRTMLEQDAQ